LSLTKVEREKNNLVSNHPKMKRPAIKGLSFCWQNAAHRAKKNAVTQVIRQQTLVMAMFRKKCLNSVKIIGEKKFQSAHEQVGIGCLNGKTHSFPPVICSNALFFYPG
jgi:hypothetical protein